MQDGILNSSTSWKAALSPGKVVCLLRFCSLIPNTVGPCVCGHKFSLRSTSFGSFANKLCEHKLAFSYLDPLNNGLVAIHVVFYTALELLESRDDLRYM